MRAGVIRYSCPSPRELKKITLGCVIYNHNQGLFIFYLDIQHHFNLSFRLFFTFEFLCRYFAVCKTFYPVGGTLLGFCGTGIKGCKVAIRYKFRILRT